MALFGGEFQMSHCRAFVAQDAEAALQVERQEVRSAGTAGAGRALQPLDSGKWIYVLDEPPALITPSEQRLGFGVAAMGGPLQGIAHGFDTVGWAGLTQQQPSCTIGGFIVASARGTQKPVKRLPFVARPAPAAVVAAAKLATGLKIAFPCSSVHAHQHVGIRSVTFAGLVHGGSRTGGCGQ